MISAEEGYVRLRDGAASASLDDFALLELTGEDRLEWLQGQASNDVLKLLPGRRLSFCFCEPTGQILAPVDAWSLEDRLLLVVPAVLSAAVLERVEKMTILEDVSARDLSNEWTGATLQGGEASIRLSQEFDLPEIDAARIEDEFILRSDRTGFGGWDVWMPRGITRILGPEVDSESLEAARIEAGIPKWGADFNSRTLPAEMGTIFEEAYVSYTKGCYTGQEVLMRMHARGHSNRTWMGLVSDQKLPLNGEIFFEERSVGKIASAALSPTWGAVAAATLRNEAAKDGVRVIVEGVEAEVRTLPIQRSH